MGSRHKQDLASMRSRWGSSGGSCGAGTTAPSCDKTLGMVGGGLNSNWLGAVELGWLGADGAVWLGRLGPC
jgi:hypothetical protein